MAKYVFIYTGGQMQETREAQEASMQAWGEFLGGLGDSVTDMGNPFGASKIVGGSGAGNAGGYSIIEADGLEAAAAKTAGCPVLADGGTIEVYEAIAM